MNILMTLNEREYGELREVKSKVEVDEYIMYAPGVFKITIEDEFKQSGTIFVKEKWSDYEVHRFWNRNNFWFFCSD